MYEEKKREWAEILASCNRLLDEIHENHVKTQQAIDEMKEDLNAMRQYHMIREKHYRDYWTKT